MSVTDRPILRLVGGDASAGPRPSAPTDPAAADAAWLHVIGGFEAALRVPGLLEDDRAFLLRSLGRFHRIAGSGARLTDAGRERGA